MKYDPEKKHREERIVRVVLRIAGVDFEDLQCSESPDFVLASADSAIAVELTEPDPVPSHGSRFTGPHVEREWAKLQRVLMEHVGRHAVTAQLHGKLFFRTKQVPSRGDYGAFAQDIVRIATAAFEAGRTDVREFPDSELVQRYLARLTLEPSASMRDWRWNYNVISLGPEMVDRALASTIERKSNLDVTAYHDAWLIIAGGSLTSQAIPLLGTEWLQSLSATNAAAQRSPFSRIIVCDLAYRVVAQWPGWTITRGP